VEEEVSESRKQYKVVKASKKIPYSGLIRRMHFINKREAELKTIKELIKNIENDKDWHHYPALDVDFNAE